VHTKCPAEDAVNAEQAEQAVEMRQVEGFCDMEEGEDG
jgi:hypothetical protein